MRRVVDSERANMFLRELGDELRLARKLRGWTRKDLLDRLGLEISLQTLATYELGTRPCSVLRFVELAEVLDVSARDVLSRALERIGDADQAAAELRLDLVTAARTRRATLGPLRRWAQARLDTVPEGRSTVVRFGLPALERLAELCGVSTVELIRMIRNLSKADPRPC